MSKTYRADYDSFDQKAKKNREAKQQDARRRERQRQSRSKWDESGMSIGSEVDRQYA